MPLYSGRIDGIPATIQFNYDQVTQININPSTIVVTIDWDDRYGRSITKLTLSGAIARAFKLRYSEHINANWEMKQNCVGIGTLVKKRKPDWEL